MNDYNPGFWKDGEEDELEDAYSDSLKFRNFVSVCPNCKQPIDEDMDSCPWCGDILFRHLQDGMFAPRKGWAVKIVAGLIVLLVILAIVGLVLQTIL